MDWQTKSASDIGRGIGAGDVDPVALTEAYLEAAETSPYGNRIYARMTRDRAMAEAIAAHDRAKQGIRRGLLDGVPISWKDLFDTAGVATEAGSLLLEGRVPERDAVVLQNATRAGLVCLGKTHMTELAFSGLGVNPNTATPPNAHDPELAPGGSSSGAATSVTYGMAAAGIGSDTGGSIRLPAAWNDLVGFKPTHNALSLEGVVPLAESFDTAGPLCRTVEDCAELFAVMGHTHAPDLAEASLKGTRFAILNPYSHDVRDAPGAAFQSAVERLNNAGALIETIEVPEVVEAMETTLSLYTAEAYGTWGKVIEANPDRMFHRIRDRFRQGKDVLAPDFVALWQRLRVLRKAYYAATSGYDAVLIPTAANMPPNVAKLDSDDDYFVTENLLTLRNTRVGNLMGVCAVTLPTGIPSTGVTLMCPRGDDARVLRLAAAAEEALS
ncbi:amidase [Gymnodinialimonas ceratoperidinii]|uniref:Amidase n=1 Tax=Gymnodinialimonas ceratoperidinii TaxID=2856823 RepID=A0A8F6YB79_9RHOB|nr:amidase family protein [Gymnodinialimonas ceratoperidinii]QXT39801.1 amidase [Gymnodinialimonas ceratoperidinii]